MQDKETFAVLQKAFGKENTSRVNQFDEDHFCYDWNVNCPNEVGKHAVRVHFKCNVKDFVQHIKCLQKPQVL